MTQLQTQTRFMTLSPANETVRNERKREGRKSKTLKIKRLKRLLITALRTSAEGTGF